MNRSLVITLALVTTLIVSLVPVCANASILLQEDFEGSGNIWEYMDSPGWTVSTWPGDDNEAYNDGRALRQRGRTAIENSADDILQIQFTHRHAAGVSPGPNWSYGGRYVYLSLVNDDGDGLIFQAESSKNRDEQTSHVDITTEWGQWEGFLGDYDRMASYYVDFDGQLDAEAHLYKWLWNRSTGQIDSFIDGALLGQFTLAPADNAAYSNFDWAVVMIEGDSRAVWVDDIEISTVPEPATLGLLALGGVALTRRRKSRGV